ncbi:MAG: N-6 DNA methylase [Bacteroidales bacterium]|nr:N-6 DNA methylase [Bacteroidales bacterium]
MEKETEQNVWLKGKHYVDSIRSLYYGATPDVIANVYPLWKDVFIEVHGNLDSQRKVDLVALSEEYGIHLNSAEDLFKLLFCLETYYSIILRLLVSKKILGCSVFSFDVFDDSFYKRLGVINYTCPAYYNWFSSLSSFVNHIPEIENGLSFSYEDNERDIISGIFESVFPKEVRHSLGEFYTPYWLASYVIDTITKGDDTAYDKIFIDPTCGSGTFLIALINKYKEPSKNQVFNSVCGIDINPLTVLAARTNYLLLYLNEYCLNKQKPITIPIYHSDIICGQGMCDNLFFEADNDYDEVPKTSFDYVVGNPPWVNWEYLPDTYRQKYSYLWQHYGLFERKGLNSNFIKEDISVLLTYVAADKYLKQNGKIAFLLKETLFKSIKQGEGFRRFEILPSGCPLEVQRVDDLSAANPFKGAVTRTAILYATKGIKTKYPVNYFSWHAKNKKNFKQEGCFKIEDFFEQTLLLARPSVKDVINSGWITEDESKQYQSELVLGKNDYTARTGTFTGGANGIFWLEILSDTNNTVQVRNIVARAKNKVKIVTKDVEKEFVFPFMTGSELEFWHYSYSKYILCPHSKDSKMYPISKEELHRYPLSEAYFSDFKTELEERKGFTSFDQEIHKQFYYTLQRIGDYTFAPYKVCWRYISKSFTPAVVEYCEDRYLGNKNIVCNEKIIFVGLNNREEAYYLCGIISSSYYRETIENYMVGTQITPGIINKLNIPTFDNINPLHMHISNACFKGHQNIAEKDQCLGIINDAVKRLLGL